MPDRPILSASVYKDAGVFEDVFLPKNKQRSRNKSYLHGGPKVKSLWHFYIEEMLRILAMRGKVEKAVSLSGQIMNMITLMP